MHEGLLEKVPLLKHLNVSLIIKVSINKIFLVSFTYIKEDLSTIKYNLKHEQF